MNKLEEIRKYKVSVEVPERKKQVSIEKLKEECKNREKTKSFRDALEFKGSIRIIAEVKKSSPSMEKEGVFREDFDPLEIARTYQSNEVAAISVITDEKFFKGSLSSLSRIRDIVDLPLLRKDFIIDPYQIYEARANGADSILLIAELLSVDELKHFLSLAGELGMECLVEAHSEEELRKVLETPANIIGINNRDLTTFKTNIDTTFRLKSMIQTGKIVVSESGISSRKDVERFLEEDINAILVGRTLMESPDIAQKLCELLGKTEG